VVLLCSIRVKLDKKDGNGRSVRMDCDCAMIECLYDFAPGRCACATICLVRIKSALGMHCLCTKCAMSVYINRSLLLQCQNGLNRDLFAKNLQILQEVCTKSALNRQSLHMQIICTPTKEEQIVCSQYANSYYMQTKSTLS
jgi:hypothetical protein